MASILNDHLEKVIEPVVKGTRNVMEACAETGVKRVVFTSSIGAVYMNPHKAWLSVCKIVQVSMLAISHQRAKLQKPKDLNHPMHGGFDI
jgi:nucleoside-diphosphate-sugar epimerase